MYEYINDPHVKIGIAHTIEVFVEILRRHQFQYAITYNCIQRPTYNTFLFLTYHNRYEKSKDTQPRAQAIARCFSSNFNSVFLFFLSFVSSSSYLIFATKIKSTRLTLYDIHIYTYLLPGKLCCKCVHEHGVATTYGCENETKIKIVGWFSFLTVRTVHASRQCIICIFTN